VNTGVSEIVLPQGVALLVRVAYLIILLKSSFCGNLTKTLVYMEQSCRIYGIASTRGTK
jgi:hypothetical protein